MDKNEIMEKWEASKAHYDPLYDDCEKDWKFLHGIGQWDNKDEKNRKNGGKPSLVLNQLLPYAQQIVNDIRQSRLAIRASPVDSSGDVDTADVLAGIIRNVERQSDATSAYTTASLYAVGAGIGWIKVKTDYADSDTFDQEAYIERVLDFKSVYPEPHFQKIDGSDMEYSFIIDTINEDRYKKLYPDRDPLNFDDSCSAEGVVSIAEFYYKDYEKDTLYQIRLIDGSIEIINSEQKKVIDDDGTVQYEILMERSVEIPSVKKCLLDGHEEPIEKEEFPCQYIPVVPVFGEEVYLDNKREFHSLIRQAKDAQKMFNYHKSESTYVLALQPKSPVVGAKGSFKSSSQKWANANRENFPFLEYDLVYDKNGQLVQPPSRQPPVQGSNAMMQEAMGAREDIRLALGMPQANMGERGGETSGIAIRNRQIEGDNATFHFIDNLAASISQVGRIIVDIIPRIYSERKIMRIIGEDGEEKNIPVNTPFVKQEGELRPARAGEKISGVYDLSAGKYDIVVDVGASYSSKRQETADKLIQLISANPQLADVTGDLLFLALDLPMSREIAERLKVTMDPAILGDDPQAAKLKQASEALAQMEQKLLDYQAALEVKNNDAQFEQSVELKKLEQESAKIAMDAQKAAADIEKTMAEVAKMKAETTGANMDAIGALGNAVRAISDQVMDIGQAVEIILDANDGEQDMGLEGAPIEAPLTPQTEVETNE